MIIAPISSEQVFPPNIYDISGNGQVSYLTESAGAGGFPVPSGNLTVSNLIMTDQPLQFNFNWGVLGAFAHAMNPNFEWRIQLYFEQWGSGEFAIGPLGATTLLNGAGVPGVPLGQVNFTATINIPANTIPVGLYDVVAIIQLYDMPSGLPCFAAAFAEFNKINFYKEH